MAGKVNKEVVFPSFSSRCKGLFCSPVRGDFEPTTDEDLILGVKPLSDQIRSFRHGGLPLGTRELGDSVYDEDGSTTVDPSIEPGLDRFERALAITDQISDRMAKKYNSRLEHADTD